MRQLDLKAKNIMESPNTNGSSSTITSSSAATAATTHLTTNDATNGSSTKQSTDNLYDEYRKRLEQIKKVKPLK